MRCSAQRVAFKSTTEATSYHLIALDNRDDFYLKPVYK
jgi:hypothetical protein